MNPRLKKLIGLFILLPGLLLYIGAVVTLAERIPEFWLAKLAYFMATGVAWAAPTIPFIRWMNKETPPSKGKAP